MAYMTLAAQGAMTATSIMGALQQGESEAYRVEVETENRARQFDANAIADEFNAKVSRQLAEAEIERAKAAATDFRRDEGAKAATSRAVQAASGVAFEGSPLMVDETLFQEIEFSAMRIGHAGDVAAARLRTQSDLLRFSAANNRVSAANARAAGAYTSESIKDSAFINAIGSGAKGIVGFGSTLATMNGGWDFTKKLGGGTGGRKASTSNYIPTYEYLY